MRYEHAAPGDLLHIDIKKFARIVKAGHRITGDPKDETRGAGWESSTSPSTTTRGWPLPPCTAMKKRPLRQTSCVRPPPTSSASALSPGACSPTTALASMDSNFFRPVRDLNITPKRTRPYTPRTNGKAERFIQTAIGGRGQNGAGLHRFAMGILPAIPQPGERK
jgi:hypothetical protein